jgi:hypothetical protein
LNSINVTRKILRRIYCRCTTIFLKISSYYAALQAVIKTFEINYTFSAILNLLGSIYCKKKRPHAEKRYCLFSFWKFFVIFHTKCKIFRSKVQRSNIYQISKYFIFVLFGQNTNFIDPRLLKFDLFKIRDPPHIVQFHGNQRKYQIFDLKNYSNLSQGP